MKGETLSNIMFLASSLRIAPKNKQRNLLSMWNDMMALQGGTRQKSFILIPNASREDILTSRRNFLRNQRKHIPKAETALVCFACLVCECGSGDLDRSGGMWTSSTKLFLCLLCVLIFISLFRIDEELLALGFGAFAFSRIFVMALCQLDRCIGE